MDKAELEAVLNAGTELMFKDGCSDAMVVFWALSVVHTLECHEVLSPEEIAAIYGDQAETADHFTIGDVHLQPIKQGSWRVF